MKRQPRRKLELATVLGIPAALGLVAFAQISEGAPVRALWQPTAALVVFGGTLTATLVSYPAALVRRTIKTLADAFVKTPDRTETLLNQLMRYAQTARRRGLMALEPEIEQAHDPFLKAALILVVEGSNSKNVRSVLEIESDARREFEEAPADVLETAAGYAPTLGILGAVLGLIHVMQSLSEPSRLGSGIAVAFVATVYGVATANLLLLPLATKIRGVARTRALEREMVIEGIASMQDGINPRLLDQKLRGFLAATAAGDVARRAA
jgi:chemotaxis protein MotA